MAFHLPSSPVSGALIGLAATRPSRWYVTGGFTTFLVISVLLYGNPELAQVRFNERVLETLLGVGVALFFGVVIPVLRSRMRRSARSTFRRSSTSTTSGIPSSRRPTERPKC
jgi:uncharacterized membrane protein YccC